MHTDLPGSQNRPFRAPRANSPCRIAYIRAPFWASPGCSVDRLVTLFLAPSANEPTRRARRCGEGLPSNYNDEVAVQPIS